MGQTPQNLHGLPDFYLCGSRSSALEVEVIRSLLIFLISSNLVFLIAKKDDYTEEVRQRIIGGARDGTGLGVEQILVVFHKKLPQERHVVRL